MLRKFKCCATATTKKKYKKLIMGMGRKRGADKVGMDGSVWKKLELGME